MNIGILSDSHGNVPRTKAAAEAMHAFKPVHVIHCGDIGSAQVLHALAIGFAETETPVTCVLGNVDWEGEYAPPMAHVHLAGRLARLEIGGARIAVIHGDDMRQLDRIVDAQEFDYIFTGHTHARDDEQRGKTRIINPGALHRTPFPGCAVLSLPGGHLQFLDL